MLLVGGVCLEHAAANVAGEGLVEHVCAHVSLQLVRVCEPLAAHAADVRPQLCVVHGLVSTQCRRERVALWTQPALEQLLSVPRSARRLLRHVVLAVTRGE